MSKTHRFNATINLGGKSYAPGSDVPIGGKNGLSEDEVSRLEREFGQWQGKTASQEDNLARLTEENGKLASAVAQLEKESARLVGENGKLAGTVTQLEADNEILAGRVKELEEAAAGKGGGSD